MINSDKLLSQRIEMTEARANAAFVETRARLESESGAEWISVAGGRAMFDGPASPITQTFGLGLFDPVGEAELAAVEDFFGERGAPVFHEVSPLAGAEFYSFLCANGYRPVELTSVLYRELDPSPKAADGAIRIRVIEKGEEETWARTSAAGWATESEALRDFMYGFGLISASCEGGHPFLAEIDGRPVSAGMLFVFGDTALLAGASTIPEARRRGVQNALLAARLAFAAELGCTVAAMGALPGSQSQKNAEKNGFRIAYTRTKFELHRD